MYNYPLVLKKEINYFFLYLSIETEKEEKPADSAPQESDDAPKKVAEDDDLKKEAPATEITPAATEIAAQ